MLTIYFYHGQASKQFCDAAMLSKRHDVWVIDEAKRLKSAIKALTKHAAKQNVSICLYSDQKPTGELKDLIESYNYYYVGCPSIPAPTVSWEDKQ